MQHSVWKRLMWLVILWGGSVLALAAVGMFFRPDHDGGRI